MKKFLFSGMILLGLLVSCQDESFSDVGLGGLETDDPAQKAITVEKSPVFDWEDNNKMYFPSLSKTITMPWYSGAIGSLPFYITDMCSKKDGWVMVYNFCTGMKNDEAAKPYLIFYNEFYGTLRVFYYNYKEVGNGSTTFWSLELDRVTSLLNASDYFAEPANEKKANKIYVTNITNLPTKTISRGWNCFDVEFSFDPEFNANKFPLRMSISAYDVAKSAVELSGNLDLNSEGTVITKVPTVSSSSGNAVASAIGGGAGAVIEKMTGVKGVGNIVSKGVNKLFGSFLGRKSKTETTVQEYTSTLKIKTSGVVNIKGEINTPTISGVMGISRFILPHAKPEKTDTFLPSYDASFGAWTIKERPVLYFSDDLIAYRRLRNTGGSWGANWVPDGDWSFARGMELKNRNTEILINPSIAQKIEKYEVSTSLVYYEKLGGDFSWAEKSETHKKNAETKSLSKETPLSTSPTYTDSDNIIHTVYNTYSYKKSWVGGQDVSDSRRPHVEVRKMTRESLPSFYLNYVVSVTVTLYPKAPYNQDPIVNTRTYLPNFVRKYDMVNTQGW